MSSIPLPAITPYNPPRFDPVEQYAKILQLRQMVQQGQLQQQQMQENEIKLRQQRQAEQDDQTFRQVIGAELIKSRMEREIAQKSAPEGQSHSGFSLVVESGTVARLTPAVLTPCPRLGG